MATAAQNQRTTLLLLVHARVFGEVTGGGAEAPSLVGESVHCGDDRRTEGDEGTERLV